MSTHDPRTRDQIRNHYEVERELGDRLRRSKREERAELFRTMYDELFARVPDHPRLLRRDTAESSAQAVAARMKLLAGLLDTGNTFLEIAPGDCRLAFAVCPLVRKVLAADISNQTALGEKLPPNFELIVYDGYRLKVSDDSVDLAFSYQFLEHLHPDDVPLHFELVRRILKPGGAYVFATPHRFSGPHDISVHFSDVPQGFHLKEWTYGELADLTRKLGFSRWHSYRFGRLHRSALVNAVTLGVERVAGILPRKIQKRLSRRVFEGVTMCIWK